MKLGEKLKKTINELEQANIKELNTQHEADLKKIRKEREDIEKFLNGTRDSIIGQINDGKVPVVKVKDYNRQSWIKSAISLKATHQDLWNDFRKWFHKEGLDPFISEGHDGMGMESWVNISVKVMPERPRGNENFKWGLKDDLGVGDYRG